MFEAFIAAIFFCLPAVFHYFKWVTVAKVAFFVTMVIGLATFVVCLGCLIIAHKNEDAVRATRFAIIGTLALSGLILGVFLAIVLGIV